MKKEDKYIARIQFKLKVLQSKGQSFEDFFVSVMTKADKDFQPVKAYGNIGDQKNDGFNKKTGTYYQVFAPEDITKDKTIYDAAKKLEQDFRGLYKKWNNLCQIKNYFFVVNDKYEGVDPIITKKILELNKEFSEVDIEAFLAKDLQRKFEKLDEDDVQELIGFIPSASSTLIEYGTLGEVVDYLMKTELPKVKNDKLIVPDFDEKITFNGLSVEVKSKLLTGSYQEGALERYFNENPGTREILQEKFHALYQMAGEEILNTQDDEADCKFYYILDRACPKKTAGTVSCVEVLMAYYFSSCDIFEEPR